AFLIQLERVGELGQSSDERLVDPFTLEPVAEGIGHVTGETHEGPSTEARSAPAGPVRCSRCRGARGPSQDATRVGHFGRKSTKCVARSSPPAEFVTAALSTSACAPAAAWS